MDISKIFFKYPEKLQITDSKETTTWIRRVDYLSSRGSNLDDEYFFNKSDVQLGDLKI